MNFPPEDDDLTVRLVRNLQEGRRVEDSARQLHDRYFPLLERFFRRKGVPANAIDDLTQETFLRVFRGIEGFRDRHEGSFAAWIFQIGRNAFKNWLRTAQTQKRDGFEIPLGGETAEETRGLPEAWLVDEGPDPLLRLTAQEQVDALHAAIAKLSDQRRWACELRYIRGLKYREIAVEMNLSIETVKAHLHQARAILESALRVSGWKPPDPAGEKDRT